MVRFEKVSKRYGKTKALREVSFEVPASQITAIAGPNGAGKTSAMKIFCGLSHYEGHVEFLDKELREQGEDFRRQRLFYVPEEKGIEPSYRVRDVLLQVDALEKQGGKKMDAEKLRQLLHFFGLDRKQNARMRELSMGTRATFYLALALSSTAEILVLDEPLSGLGPVEREFVIRELKSRAMNGGTVFYSSHILEEIEEVAERLVVLHNGRVLYQGGIDEAKDRFGEVILERPARPEALSQREGVLWTRRSPGEIYHFFIDRQVLKEKLPGKEYSLKLKEIFLYLIEKEKDAVSVTDFVEKGV